MLHLYKNITPNTDDRHYYFTTPTQYKNAITSNLVKSVALDNYRINTNVIKVALDNTLTEAIADTLTYAIDERVENNVITYFRAYHVNRIAIQSGYVILYCSVDNWASYLYKATISNLNVTRCNRNIGTGLLDQLQGTKGNATRSYCETTGTSAWNTTPNMLMERNRVYIVFALKYNIEQNNAGSVSKIGLYAFNIQNLVTRLYNANKQTIDEEHDSEEVKAQKRAHNFNWSIVNPVELALDVVSGIYGIVGTSMWGGSGTLNAVVIGAWFSDSIITTSSNLDIKSKAHWANFYDVVLTPYEVARIEVTKTLTIANNFDKQLYVGTLQNGLKLQRTTEATISVCIKTIPSNDKLKVIAYQGDTQQDITDAFSTTIGITDGDVTAERQVLEVVQNSIKFIGAGLAMAKGVASGNGLAVAMGVQGFANTLAGSLDRSQHSGNMVSGGDGAIAYWRNFTGSDYNNPTNNLSTPVTNPYVINAYESINDEKANVRLVGAKFSELTTFASVFSASLMGTGAITATYIQASCNVDNIPTDASDIIKLKLSNGIYLVNLS